MDFNIFSYVSDVHIASNWKLFVHILTNVSGVSHVIILVDDIIFSGGVRTSAYHSSRC